MHATDATNASRTLLFDIARGAWDAGAVRSCSACRRHCCRRCAIAPADFGATLPELFGGAIRILGIAGDQQAATIGQGCFTPGMMKSTYGTGCFALLNTGAEPVRSRHRLLTTIAYQLDGKRTYALEGAIFIAGAAVQWLRDGLQLIDAGGRRQRAGAEGRSGRAGLSGAGLRRARRAATGMPRRAARCSASRAIPAPPRSRSAALEAVGYQTRDLLEAMRADWPAAADTVLRVDGGMTASDVTMQFLADILGAPVDRPVVMETTALGAAYLAGYQAGVCPDPQGFAATWRLERRFEPAMDAATRARKWAGWQDAVRRVRTSVTR